MEIIHFNLNEHLQCVNTVSAIGFFDGFHLGHLELFKEVQHVAKEKSLKKAMITFSCHPQSLLLHHNQKLLMTLQDKIIKANELQFDYLYIIDFDETIASLTPDAFIQEFILKKNVKHLVCGFDFHFGAYAKGSIDLLKTYHEEFDLSVIKKYTIDHHKVSSSAIRKLLMEGNIEKANQLLNHQYTITGTVIEGKKIGRTIGFPTANIEYLDYLLPKKGVYSTIVSIDGKEYKGMSNVGFNPTFTKLGRLSLEVHILHFNQDIYGQEIQVRFIKRLRSEKKFSSKEELIQQLNHDKEFIDNDLFLS